jgi:hypothetical protein
MVHVSDWMPTIVNLAGGNTSTISGLDGHDVWEAVTSNSTSPRTELLHNIDTFGSLGSTGFGNAALRVGPLKLVVGAGGGGNHHYIPPGCKPEVCVLPSIEQGCVNDTKNTSVWLFDIEHDPYELCNRAESRPEDVKRLLVRLKEYNDTAVPILYPDNDPKANPADREGVEKGSWGPWIDPTPPTPPTSPPTPAPAPAPTAHCVNVAFGPCKSKIRSTSANASNWQDCCAKCVSAANCSIWGFNPQATVHCQLHTGVTDCKNGGVGIIHGGVVR